MALGRFGQGSGLSNASGTGSRVIELVGDSPEIVALALLRQLAQIEQQELDPTQVNFDRRWLLNAYAECLTAVRGQRQVPIHAADPIAKVGSVATPRERSRPRARSQA
jgi:hypothetical protein